MKPIEAIHRKLRSLGAVVKDAAASAWSGNGGMDSPASDVADQDLALLLKPSARRLKAKQLVKKIRMRHDLLLDSPGSPPASGGWNCYYGKPGPKTMPTGWNKLDAMAAGYAIAKAG